MKRKLIAAAVAALMAWLPALAGDNSSPLYTPHVGFTAGVGGEFTTGSLHDNFGNDFIFAGGFTGGYRLWRIKAEFAYGQPSFGRPNLYDVRDEQGRDLQLNTTASPSHLRLGVAIGYTVWHNSRWAVTPLAGFAWNRYKWDINDIEWSTNEKGEEVFGILTTSETDQSGIGWLVGMDIDVRLHSHLIPNDGDRVRRYTSYLRVSPFVTHVRQSSTVPQGNGVLVGLTVNYCGLLSFIH